VRPRRLVFEPFDVERLAHGDDRRDVAAGLRDGGAHERVDLVGGFAEEHEPDRAAGEQFVHRERVQAVGERFLVRELFVELACLPARGADFGVEVRDDPVLGGGHEVGVADRDAEQHADHQRQQDSGE
jgi:hypothetical protein